MKVVSLGRDVQLQLLTGPGQTWLGLGEITVSGTRLRAGDRPLILRLDTPEGILYTQFQLGRVHKTAKGGAEVHLRACGTPWVRQEILDEYTQPLLNLPPSLDPVEDEVILHLEPLDLELGGLAWRGFSYAFTFWSKRRQIHRMLVDATWELGGSIVGNTVLNQSQCSPPVYRGQRRTHFATTCLKRIDCVDSPQGVSYQLAPRGGMLQAFDFQHGKEGALLHYWPRLENIASNHVKVSGQTRLHVVDEYRFPLARRVTTTPQHVLFTPGPLPEHEARDLWWAAYELVTDAVQRRHRVRPTVVLPEVDPPRSGRVHEGRVQLRVGEEWVDAAESLYAVADRLLPGIAANGVRRLMNPLIHESDVTVLGLRRKLDTGLDGDLFCGSLCATHRFQPSEFWGGMKAWRYLAQAGHQLGLEMGHWFAPHLSPRAEIFNQHPDWLMTGVNSLTFGGGYWNILAALDWNTGVREWILEDLRRWHDEGGLDYLFVDSWPNLGLLPINYAAGFRSNQPALEQFFGQLQEIGIRAFSFEGISCLGISRISIADLRGDKEDGLPGVVGQNDFGWWRHELDMAYNLNIHLSARGRSDEEQEQMVFAAMAARGGLILPKQTGGGRCPLWLAHLQHTYNAVLPHMQQRRLLPGRTGVEWTDGKCRVLWLFKPLKAPAGTRIEQVSCAEGGPCAPRAVEHRAELSPWQVYRITTP